jgi:hypothetical protein
MNEEQKNLPAQTAPEKEQKLSRTLIDLAGSDLSLRAEAFRLLDSYKQSQMVRAAAAEIASLSWGQKISPATRAQIAAYALSQGTDPVRHWEILGGRLYDRAELWMDLVAAQPDYEGHRREFIHDDGRLPQSQRKRRQQLRAEHGVPEEVPAAAIVTIYRTGKLPAVGVNWAGTYPVQKTARTGKPGFHEDPIGDENPTKTAETRAFRKAAKKAYPLHFRTRRADRENGIPLTNLDRVEEQIERERQEAKAAAEEDRPEWVDLGSGLKIKAGGETGPPVRELDDPYDVGQETRELADTEVETEAPADKAELQQIDFMEGK